MPSIQSGSSANHGEQMARTYSERPRRSPILHPTRRFFRYHGMEESCAFRLSSRELQLVEVIADIQHEDPERDAGTRLTWRAQRDGCRSYPIYAVHALYTHGPRVSKPTSFVHLQRHGHIERTTISSPHTEETHREKGETLMSRNEVYKRTLVQPLRRKHNGRFKRCYLVKQ